MSGGWQISSYSGNGGCYAVSRDLTGDILIRNSNRPEEWIQDTNRAFAVFIAGAKAGEFDHLLDGDANPVTHAELHAEIARLSVEVEKLRSALRHPSSRQRRSVCGIPEHGQ